MIVVTSVQGIIHITSSTLRQEWFQVQVDALRPTLSQSGEISPDFCCFHGGGIRHNEDIMHSFQNFIVWLIPNHPTSLETRIWKFVVRALIKTRVISVIITETNLFLI